VSGREQSFEAAAPSGDAPPIVSVIMANYQGAAHIGAALASVLGQTFSSLEVIVSDDASSDASLAIVQAAMRSDSRVRLIEAPANGGPARARNRALEAARGAWIAIVDSDDIIHPERLERLLAAAARLEADIVADDLLTFSDGPEVSTLLDGTRTGAFSVTARDWIAAGSAGTPALGYVKPLIRRTVLGEARYDETLRIGEDFDLLLRLLLGGARFQMIAEPWYLYRRHGGSISHRLSIATMAAMITAQQAVAEKLGPFEPALAEAFAERLAGLRHGLDFELLVAALKRGRVGEAIGVLGRDPGLLSRLVGSAGDRLRREAARLRPAQPRTTTRALHLAEQARPGSLDEAAVVETVPPYPSPSDTSWGRHRAVWMRLAGLGAGAAQPLNVSCDGAAGRYAAGFIPGAMPAAVAVASAVNDAIPARRPSGVAASAVQAEVTP